MTFRSNTLNALAAACAMFSFALYAEEKVKNPAPVIYPLDRASILVGAKFDIKIEFQSIIAEGDAKITINDKSLNEMFGRAAEFIEKEDSGALPIDDDDVAIKAEDDDAKKSSALILRDCILNQPGSYTLNATDGKNSAKVSWVVFKPEKRLAKNVIWSVMA
jgi:alkaline phosphatase